MNLALDVYGCTCGDGSDACDGEECTFEGHAGPVERAGVVDIVAEPHGRIDAFASAEAQGVVAQAAVQANLSLIELRVPLTGRLAWGVLNEDESGQPQALALGMDAKLPLTLKTMTGELAVTLEHLWTDCDGWYRLWTCEKGWQEVRSTTLASWSGHSYNTVLYQSVLTTTIP